MSRETYEAAAEIREAINEVSRSVDQLPFAELLESLVAVAEEKRREEKSP